MSDYHIEKSIENSIVSKRGNAGSIVVSGKKKIIGEKRTKTRKTETDEKTKTIETRRRIRIRKTIMNKSQ